MILQTPRHTFNPSSRILVRIERMNARVLQLAHDWEKCRDTLDSASADEVRDQIQQAKAQAIRLQEVCRLHAQKLQMTRNTLGERIAALGNAARHLESLKPIKNNYPKFIDSRY
jgi:chromosome segregation ATPase